MKKDKISDRIIEYILMCNDEELANLCIKNLAKFFSMNLSYLSQQFFRDKGISIGAYLAKLRVFRAAVILRENTTISVTELGKRMGFVTTEHFILVFRKFLGATPGTYRKCKGQNQKVTENV